MFIVVLVRWLLGYVSFAGEGGFPERFLNLCVQARIPLWDLRRSKTRLEGCTSVRGYLRIRPVARRSGVRVRLKSRRGLPVWLKAHRSRAGLAAGLAAAVLVIACLSTRVWTIGVTGNVQIPQEAILEAAEELGVRVGARRSALDAPALAEALLDRLPALSWAAVNLDACRAVIEVREGTPAPEIVDTQTPRNIIAAEDGVLTKVEVFSGTAGEGIAPGSAVAKGDLLIAGVTEHADGTQTLCAARGNAYAELARTLDFSFPDTPFLRLGAAAVRYRLFFFGLNVPLGPSPGENAFTVERYLANGEVTLPVGLWRERAEAYSVPYTPQDRATRARYVASQYAAAYAALWAEGVLLESDAAFRLEQETPEIRGTVRYEKEIGCAQQIFVEKISD